MRKLVLSLCILTIAMCAWATDNVTASVYGANLDIALNNTSDYTAFQMDIQLPAGINATSIEAARIRLTQNGTDTVTGGTKFILSSKVIDTKNNILRVVAYNLANKAIEGTSGADILKIKLDQEPAAPDNVKVSNVIFVAKLNLASTAMADTTGVKGFAEADANRDNYVNAGDINSVLNVMTGSTEDSRTDVNNDSYVNAGDINSILNIMTGGK